MTSQPQPRPGGEPVPPVAREHVYPEASEWLFETLEEQVIKGKAKYPEQLTTFNGRDPLQDTMAELVDAVQYVTQAKMERQYVHAALVRWLAARDAWDAPGADRDRRQADAIVAATAALEALARKVVG